MLWTRYWTRELEMERLNITYHGKDLDLKVDHYSSLEKYNKFVLRKYLGTQGES